MNYFDRQRERINSRTKKITLSRLYGQMESEPNPQTWSAREKAYKNTALEAKGYS